MRPEGAAGDALMAGRWLFAAEAAEAGGWVVFIVKGVAIAVAGRVKNVRLADGVSRQHGGYADCEGE